MFQNINYNNNYGINKKNILLSVPRCGNHIIRTFIEYFTNKPTHGLLGLDEQDLPIYKRSSLNIDITEPTDYIYYKQHDLILNEPHFVSDINEVNELIFLTRNPIEIFLKEETTLTELDNLIPYKKLYKEVYFDNIDFYEKFEGKKLLLYYEDIIQCQEETIRQLYFFLNIHNPDKLSFVLNNLSLFYEETLKLSINTNGGKSKSISYYSELYNHHEIYQKNNNYIIAKIKEQPYYQKILQRYL